MDIEMNGVDGITATRQIISAYPQARIIIVTEYDDDDMRLAAAEAAARRISLSRKICFLSWKF